MKTFIFISQLVRFVWPSNISKSARKYRKNCVLWGLTKYLNSKL